MMQKLVRRLGDVFPATVEEQFGTEGARGGFSWSMRGLGRQSVGVDWAGASPFELPTAMVARRLEGGMLWRGEDASAAAGDEIAHICGVVMLLGLLPEEKRSPSLDFVSPTPGFVLDVVSRTQAAANSRYTASCWEVWSQNAGLDAVEESPSAPLACCFSDSRCLRASASTCA